MPGLYGFTSNANVAVTNTTGLYQLTSNIGVVQSSYGNTQVAAFLPTYTGNVSSAGLGLTGIFTDHYYYANGAPFIGGGGAGTYSNSNVASYLITSTGNIQAGNITVLGNLYVQGNTITTYTANTIASQIIANGAIPSTSTTTGALQSYGGLGVQGNINAGAVYTNNYFYANGASIFSGITGNYGNSNVGAYLSSGTVGTITTTGNIKSYGNLIAPGFLYPNGVSILTGVTANYGNANVTALLAGTVNVGNLITTSGVYWANGQPYSSGSGTTYGNANVAAFLPHYGGVINSGTIFNDSGFAIQGRDYTQMQYTNGVTPPVSEYDIGVGAWFYIDAGGGIFQSNTTGNLKTITFGHDASINAGGNVTAPYYIGNGSLLTNLPIQPGTYSNTNVAAYLSSNTDPTISNLNANTQQQQAQINATNANIGSFYTYANVTYSTIANAASQQGQIDSINANVTASNAAIQTLSANLGSFETYANVTYSTIANAASQQGQIDSINANVTAANAAIVTANTAMKAYVDAGNTIQSNQINTINANIGGFYTYANATYSTIANAASQQGQIDTLQSQVYSNANAASYLTVYTGNIQAGNVSILTDLSVGGNTIITGNLTVYGNTTTINSNVITTNDLNITVGNNQTTGAALNNAGIDVGSNNLATWRFNNASTSWQSNINITPQSNAVYNLGAPTLQWNTIYGRDVQAATATYTGNVVAGNISATNLTNQYNFLQSEIDGANAAIVTANTIQSNQINATNANIGSFYTYANVTYSTIANAASQQGQIDSINANVTAANAAIITANTAMKAYVDAGNTIQSNQINTINANIGSFYTYANVTYSTIANAASQQGQIDSINSNVTAANAAIQTLSANVGSFYTYANATYSTISNAASQQGQIDSINSNVTAANAAIAATNANIGSFYTYANVTYSTISNAASQQGQINSINSNVTAANAAIQTLSANVGAFETVTNIWLGNLQANVYSNANVSSYMSRYSAPIQFAVASSGNNQTFTNSVIGYYPTNQTMQLFHNGVLVPYADYTIAGNVLTVNEYLTAGDTLNVPPIVIAGNVSSLVSGVSQIVAGTGVTISPAGGTGVVTINSSGGSGTYSNTNVAAYLPNYGGQIQSTNMFSDSFVQMQYSPTLPVDQNTLGAGNWAFLDAGGFSVQNNTAGRGFTSNFLYDLYGNLSIANGNVNLNNGNVTATYFIGDGSKLTNLPGGSGTYGNANVAAFLPSYTGNLTANNVVIAGNLTVNGATTTININEYVTGNIFTSGNITANAGGYFNGDGSKLTNLPIQSGTYSNANVAAYMPVFGGNILAGNIDIPYTAGTRNRGPLAIGGNLNHYDSGVVASFQGNEATYLYTSLQNSNTGNTAYASYAVNDGSHTYYGELGINSGTYDYAAAGYPNNAFSLPYATFIQSTGANLAIGTYDNNGISFLVNGQTNTADAMTIANSGNVTVTGNLAVGALATVGNIKSTAGYFWSNGDPYSSSPVGAAGGDLSGTYPNPTLVTSGVGAGTYGSATLVPQIVVDSKGRITSASNVAISASGFTGNLLGSTLLDSVNNRIIANAYPLNSVSTSTLPSNGSSYATYLPVYTSGNLIATNASGVNQTLGLGVNGNINLLTQWGVGNRTSSLLSSYMQVTATSANTAMNSADRFRTTASYTDLNLNGKSWGAMSTASTTGTQAIVNTAQLTIYGPGSIGAAAGASGTVIATAYQGSANVQYATGVQGIVQQASATGATVSSVQYGRLFGGFISGQTGNVTMVNAVGLHTFSGWVSANTSLVQNAYTVLNEDTRSVISTVGNINLTSNLTSGTGTLITSGNITQTQAAGQPIASLVNLKTTGYIGPAKNYYDTGTTANIVVSGTNTKTFQQIALNANATIYSSALGFDTVYDFSIQQDGTGNRTLSWFQTGGAYTPTGILNPAPNSTTYARAIMSDTGYWTVAYSNASVPVLTVTQTNSFVGTAGSMVAVSNGTAKNSGQLAYWDVTNTRWSWVDTNLAVT